MRKRTWFIIVIVVILILGIVGILNYKNQLQYDAQFNNLILKIINSKNNEKIFHTINHEYDGHKINVLDISGGAFEDIQYIVYLLRVNDHYLNENIDMFRMFNVFGGISSGSIIACAIAFRELVLKNVLKNHKSEFIQCMQIFKYSDTQIVKCMAHIADESTQLNYGTIILQWLFYLYLDLKTKLLNVSFFKKITTLNGFLYPSLSSKNKHIYLKNYFDFDLKDIVKSRTFISCAMIIPSKTTPVLQTENQLVLFTNSTNSINDTNLIRPKYNISNMADIINITTNTTGIFSVNEQFPKLWDAGIYINNISFIIFSLFTNYSYNLNLKYVSLNNIVNLTYANYEGGLRWWYKNLDNIIRIHTKYDIRMMQYIQKNKAQIIYFKNNTKAFDDSNVAVLNDIQSGINVSTNDLITFIHNEI
jgi:hypothetical protein